MKTKSLAVLPILLAVQSALGADNLSFDPSVGVTYLHADTDQPGDERNLNSFTVSPSLITSYMGPNLKTRLTLKHDKIHRRVSFENSELASQSVNKGFTSFDYSGNADLIDNVFSVNFSGRQGYQNTDPTSAFFDERFINLEGLTKTRANSAGFNFVTPNPKYFGVSTYGSYSEVKTDRQTDTLRQLDDKNTSAGITLYSGSDVDFVTWNLNSTYTDTDRTAESDVVSRRSSGSVYLGLFNNFSFVVTGSTESNDLSNDSELSSGFGNDTYGTGFSWQGRGNRRIDITYNKSEQNNGESKNFVGFDINWPFSSRTTLVANYGRRFFGESKNLTFKHGMKRLSTSITYNESVTTYSRLISQPTVLGLLVCPIESTSVIDCFVPDSLDYVPSPNEEATEITGLVPEISEQVTLRKKLQARIGYEFRKLSISAHVSRSDIDYLETTRQQIERSAGLSITYKYSPRTSITFGNEFSEFERNLDLSSDELLKSNLTLDYKLSRNLTSSLGFKYLDRDSDQTNLDQTDRRITLDLNYKF